MAVEWRKCAFFQKNMDCVGNSLVENPLVGKTDSLKNHPNPKNISELSFFPINKQMHKICHKPVNHVFTAMIFFEQKSIYHSIEGHTLTIEDLKKYK